MKIGGRCPFADGLTIVPYCHLNFIPLTAQLIMTEKSNNYVAFFFERAYDRRKGGALEMTDIVGLLPMLIFGGIAVVIIGMVFSFKNWTH